MAESNVGVTEIVTFPVREGLKPTEGFDSLYGVKAPGYVSGRYSWKVEDKNVFHFALNWESLKAHQNLMAKPEYGPVLAKINEWADGVSFFHAALTPHPPTATFTAPATEVAKLPAKPESTKDDWLLGYHKFEKGLKNAPGYIAHASGWQIEDDRCFVLAIGWEAVEAHRDWAKSEAGSAAIKSLMERTDQEKSEMWHLCDVGAVIVN